MRTGCARAGATRGAKRFVLALSVCVFVAWPVCAAITVSVAAPGGRATETLSDEGGAFAVDIPLSKNSVNRVMVTASDADGNTASKGLSITQVSLDDVVITEFTSEPLSPERIEELVNEGVIDLEDPENYNVSEFTIVLTINNESVPVTVPIVVPRNEADPSGWETYQLPSGDDGSSGRPQQPEVEIVVFEKHVPGPPGQPAPPPIPGVLIIEGRIKSLKEFFSCRLLLMNASGIFTLSDVVAELEFPNGGLSNVLPADGIVSFGDILPGDGTQPGQVEKEFIIRGDEIGVRKVRVHFGGMVTGPGIAEDAAIPFNGSAETSVEVKGPPDFDVRVFHPAFVEQNVPYDMRVDITNTGEMPALYASLEIDVAGAGELIEYDYDAKRKEGDYEVVDGPVVRSLGHVHPGDTVSQTFTINPARTGAVSSCVAASDQNVSLEVYVGSMGCMVGHYPPESDAPEGIPTVSVVPVPNALSVGVDTPVVAFFSEVMRESTIVTGPGGSFNVFNEAGDRLPGEVWFDRLGVDTDRERTVAIWQCRDATSAELPANSELTVVLTQDVVDQQGNALFSLWESTFTTTGEGVEDTDPPTLTLSVEPPVDPSFVLPGELVRVNGYAADAGSGVARVEARLKDVDTEGATYTLIDQKSVAAGEMPPYIFTLDSAALVPGHAYQVRATAYDFMGNGREETIHFVVASTADPPTIVLPADPTLPVLQGISVDVTPLSYTGGVRQIEFFLDDAEIPFNTTRLHPYQARVRTLALALGAHSVRAVATDGLGQVGEDTLLFELIENVNMPVVSFGAAVDGAQHVIGSTFLVRVAVEDPIGIAGVEAFLDGAKEEPLTVASSSIRIDTSVVGLGDHVLTVVATNLLGVSNDPSDPASVLEFSVVEPPPGEPPDPPVVTNVSYPDGRLVTVQGTTVAGGHVVITNTTLGFVVAVDAGSGGTFEAVLEADAGHVLNLVAYDYGQSPDPSGPTVVTVEAAPVLERIEATPETMTFTSFGVSQAISVVGYFESGATGNLTARATFTSSDSRVTAVNTSGTVAPIANGNATITAAVDGHTDDVAVTVNVVVLTHITVEPTDVALVAIAQTRQLVVTKHYSDGSSQVVASGLSYVVGDPNVATVNSGGIITAVGDGLTQVTVYLSGAAPVVVPVSVNTGADPAPTARIVSPADGTEIERGETVAVSVRAEDAIGGVTKVYLEVTGATTYSTIRQVSPPALSTLESFAFTVDGAAPLGGAVVVRAYAEDTSGHRSAVDTVTLVVVDKTSPTVSVIAPVPMAEFRYGDTVTVTISAEDAVAVTRIRFEATGAIVLSRARDIVPPAPTAQTSFAFLVPYGMAYPDVRIQAYASDSEGNEGAATPVDILITDADVTPPETVATGVTDASDAAARVVSYEILSGQADLDHVELFFRRDGFGTFNRYTRADAGYPTGHFTPQSGNIGWIRFDSTRMGGDGRYEFYTVGVDSAGNREPAPDDGTKVVTADQEVTIAAGTVWTTIDEAAQIGVGDATYDDQNVRIDGVTVSLAGHHQFHNIELVNGAVLAHPETDTENGWALDFEAWTVTVDSASRMDGNARGYLGGRHSHSATSGYTLGNTTEGGATYRSAGSYGGVGGAYDGTPNALYGNLVSPADLGSGGSSGYYGEAGGDGGGRVHIAAVNVVLDGTIAANGGSGGGSQAGSGSGGAVCLVVSTLSGIGGIGADGGGGEVGGGGGRVAVHHVDMSTMDSGLIHALGGQGSRVDGGNGTVFLKGFDEANGTLVVDGQGTASAYSALPIPPGYVFDNIIIRNQARVVADDVLKVNDTLAILTGSILTHSLSSEDGLRIEASRLYVDLTSSIDISSRGYRGGKRDGNDSDYGLTLGGVPGAQYRSAGSYGGYGGVYDGSGSNPPYGHPNEPVYLGSGGSRGYYGERGGNGGGRVTILAGKSVEVDGAILANGGGGGGSQAGSGSGGSILIETSLLRGMGVVAANGGAAEVGGGGGRVAITYDYFGGEGDDLDALRAVSAFGGHGNRHWGSAGTVVLRSRAQSFGDLYVDDDIVDGEGHPNGTSSAYTPLTPICFGAVVDVSEDTLTTDGAVPWLAGGLVGIEINPNTAQVQTYVITANTADTVTVDRSGKPALTDVTSIGDTYAGVYRFDNVYFRRGGFLVLGDRLIVDETMRIDEYGRLTHYDAGTSWESRLDLDVGLLEITATGSVNVDLRGYLGGNHNGAGGSGRTLGNVDGAAYRSGGSYGGIGGQYDGTTNAIYGSVTTPQALGSGGSKGYYSEAGGDGGGRVYIEADTLVVDGVISANGGSGGGSQAGSGSGGSLYLVVGELAGAGAIRANGGGGEVGGGGGRIAVHYATFSVDASQLEVLGGQGSSRQGGNGTLCLIGPGQTWGDLVIDGLGQSTPSSSSPIPDGYIFDNIRLRNQARVVADAPLHVTGAVEVLTGSVLTHTVGKEAGLRIEATSVFVDGTSSIDASSRGYPGARRDGNAADYGLTLGRLPGAVYSAGGTYAGYGGVYDGAGSNRPYGHPAQAVYLGSGGSRGYYSEAGGTGGGRITIVAEDFVKIDGAIRANGGGGDGSHAGSGSGGSIDITTGVIRGTGWIIANGGVAEVGGGGGRIVITANAPGGAGDDLAALRNATAFGGHGSSRWGSAGTVLFRDSVADPGVLYVDDGLEDATSSVYTPLTPICFGTVADVTDDTLTTDGKVPLMPNGLVGVEINPNIDQDATFLIVSNTEDTVTVDTGGKVSLTAVADVGDTYVGVYRFREVRFRRGGFLVTGDRVVVDDAMVIDEYGRVTHFDATTTFESRLDLTAGELVVAETGSINVNMRGYLGGNHNGSGSSGRTLGNIDGSTFRSGGSYGGLGGSYEAGVPNPACGDARFPAALGSGGSRGYYSEQGGDGGGWAILRAGTLTVDGVIAANGGTGGGSRAGSGSGGTIRVDTGVLRGTGSIQANGGGGEVGGGGGRIAIDYALLGDPGDDLEELYNIVALGGHGSSSWGSAGTVVLRGPGQAYGDLYIDDGMTDNGGVPNATSSAWTPLTHIGFGEIQDLAADTITVDGKVRMLTEALIGLDINPNIEQGVVYRIVANTLDTITVDTAGKPALTDVAAIGSMYVGVQQFDNLTFRRGGFLVIGDRLLVRDTMSIGEYGRMTHYDATTDWESHLELTVGTLTIDVTGSINLDGRGYLGGNHNGNGSSGLTLGNVAGATYRSAGSYGGFGAQYDGATNALYGDEFYPAALGSGGARGYYGELGGDGAGWIRIHAGALWIDGAITANGTSGAGSRAGGGSGGTIYIEAPSVGGSGAIHADGGGNELGGGGGRVAVYYVAAQSDVTGVGATASGGAGSTGSGGVGTVHVEAGDVAPPVF